MPLAAAALVRLKRTHQLYGVPRSRATTATARGDRLFSLDAFRGITIVAMILVNNPGTWDDVYAPLQHAAWDGWTFADLIFPFFLFIVGVAVAFSIAQMPKHAETRGHLLAKVWRRALTMLALGIVLNGFPLFDWSNLRLPGVLQRIALCYGFTSMAVLAFDTRGLSLVIGILLVGYWLVMALVPVPSHPLGSTPGPDINLAAYIDDALMHGHLLHYRSDPEGVLSTVPTIATTLSGVIAGRWLQSRRGRSERGIGLLVAGDLALVLGVAISGWCPINKSLWSSSYVIFTAGFALNAFGLCYWLCDVKRYRRWATPFVVYGTNPIVAYVLSSLLAKVMLLWKVTGPAGARVPFQQFIFAQLLLPLASPVNASLLYAVAYALLWLALMAFLYRRRVLIRI